MLASGKLQSTSLAQVAYKQETANDEGKRGDCCHAPPGSDKRWQRRFHVVQGELQSVIESIPSTVKKIDRHGYVTCLLQRRLARDNRMAFIQRHLESILTQRSVTSSKARSKSMRSSQPLACKGFQILAAVLLPPH
jgi:hypothetical protein